MAPEIITLTLGAFATNSYLVGNPETGEALLIDPVDDAPLLLRSADEAGWTIRLILATHGHVDHVLAAAALTRLTGAPFQIHHASPRLQPEAPADPLLAQLFPPLPRPARCLGDEDEQVGVAGISLRTIFTPGHAPDHVAFYLPDQGVLFGGDCLFAGSIGRTDFPNASLPTLMRSITQRLLRLPDETRVLPGHMGPTTIGTERNSNPFLLEYLRTGDAADGPFA